MKRLATIQDSVDLGTNGTKTFDIDVMGQISAIDIRWRCTNVTVSVMLNWIFSCISKIEVVDGSEVLASVSGAELFALDYYNNGKLPHYALSLKVGGFFEFACRLNFGRYLWDKEYALRPEMYRNLQLRITWDEDACNTSVVVNSFAAYAHVDDTPSEGGARGFLLTKEIKTYGLGGATHEYTDLPVDGNHRLMLLHAYTNDHDMSDLIESIKIDLNAGNQILLHQSIADMILCSNLIGVEQVLGTGDDVVTAKTIYSPFMSRNRMTLEYDGTVFVTVQSKFALSAYTGAMIAAAASVDIKANFLKIQGTVPGGCVPIVFGDMNDPDTWLKVSPNDNLRVDILGLAASDSADVCALVTQQEKIY